jgi:hypothetical protein
MIDAIETAVAANFAPAPRSGAAAAGESTSNSAIGIARAAREAGATPSSGVGVGRSSALIDFGGVATLQAGATSLVGGQNLTDEERRAIQRLSARDQEVRRHEGAHARAAESRGDDDPSLTSRVDQPPLGAGFVGESSSNPAFTATCAGASTLFDVVA